MKCDVADQGAITLCDPGPDGVRRRYERSEIPRQIDRIAVDLVNSTGHLNTGVQISIDALTQLHTDNLSQDAHHLVAIDDEVRPPVGLHGHEATGGDPPRRPADLQPRGGHPRRWSAGGLFSKPGLPTACPEFASSPKVKRSKLVRPSWSRSGRRLAIPSRERRHSLSPCHRTRRCASRSWRSPAPVTRLSDSRARLVEESRGGALTAASMRFDGSSTTSRGAHEADVPAERNFDHPEGTRRPTNMMTRLSPWKAVRDLALGDHPQRTADVAESGDRQADSLFAHVVGRIEAEPRTNRGPKERDVDVDVDQPHA